MNFDQFQKLLWSQDASGERGFEGLVRKLLEGLTGQRFFLSLAGRQEGRDIASSAYNNNFVAVECKRYKENSHISSDELLAKFFRAARSIPSPDLWIVVTTKRLGEQHHRDLQIAGDKFGISFFAIDAEGEDSSYLASLCSAAPKVVVAHLKTNPPTLSDSEADEVENYLSDLACSETGSTYVDRLKSALLCDTVGYSHWRTMQNRWLVERFSSPPKAVSDLAQDMAVRANGCRLVKRKRARQALDDWWADWPTSRQHILILGEEGDGKSWVVADWLSDGLKQENFPPILFLPSTRVDSTEPMELTVGTLRWQLGEQRAGYWEKRLHRWLNQSVESDPVFVLVLDGTNERPGFNWRLLFSRLDSEPFLGRVAVIATCRTLYCEERLNDIVVDSHVLNVDPYDDDELTQALSQRECRRDEFGDNLLQLLRKPRYLDLAVKLRKQLSEQGEVTVDRLIYEDWRDQQSRKLGKDQTLTHQDFQELISSICTRWQTQKGVLKRSDVYKETETYGDGKILLNELSSGRVLRRDGTSWIVDNRYLVLGLGLLLADEVKQAAQNGVASMDELIASCLEPQRDMDLKVSICGMALFHALYRDDYPDAGRLSLFRAWIQGRNIKPEDWRGIPAYLPLRPDVYLQMAEYLWSTVGENHDVQDAFMAGFLRFSNEEKVKAAIIPAFECWMGYVHPCGHHGRSTRNEERRRKGREDVCNALGSDIESGKLDLFGYSLELTKEEGWLRLAGVALAVISHRERKPYLRALASYALAGAVMGHPYYDVAFSWVLRTAQDPIEEPILKMAQKLMGTGTSTAQKAAWWLLTGLSSADALELRDQIPPGYGFKNFFRQAHEKNPCGRLVLWDRKNYLKCIQDERLHPTSKAEQSREVVLEPGLAVPDVFPKMLEHAGEGMDFDNIARAIGQTAEDVILENMEPTLCAFRPERLAELWRNLARKLPERVGESRHKLAHAIYEHLLIMEDDERMAIERAWLDTLESDLKEDEYAEYVLFPCALWGRNVEEQLDLIEKRGDRMGHFESMPPRIGKLAISGLSTVAARLERLANHHNHSQVCNLLWSLSNSLTRLNEGIRKILLQFFNQRDSAIRMLCLLIFRNTQDHDACRSILDRGWRANQAEGDRERHWGSVLLCEQGTDLHFSELAERISTSFLGYAVQCRGNRREEVAAYSELIHRVWCGIAERKVEEYPELEHARRRVNRVEQSLEPEAFYFDDANQGSIRFVSYDSIWGGGSGRDNPDDITQAFDLDARTRRLNEANMRLCKLVEVEQRAGNMWFLSTFNYSALEEVVITCPDYVEQWIRDVLREGPNADALLMRCRGFYEAICRVLLNLKPEIGVKLFRHLRTKDALRCTDSTTGIDALLFSPFSTGDSEELVQLRRLSLEECTTDKSILEIAFLSQLHGKREELMRIANELLASQRPFDLARGLTLLGFMDTKEAEKELEEWTDSHRESWIRGSAERAQHIFHRNQWAKQWFQLFLECEENLQAWAAFRLFLHCVDRRFWSWGPEMVKNTNAVEERIEQYYANHSHISKAAKKNEKDVLKLEKRLVGIETKEDQVWPWMSRYLEPDYIAMLL